MQKKRLVTMKTIRLINLENMDLKELTSIWNRCWRGYYFDMTYTPEHMRVWLHLSQVNLRHSRAIVIDDQIAGFALLSVFGNEGWIAGTSLDPNYRGKGLFKPLMLAQLNAAACLGLKRVYLEVLIQNHALKVYQSVGFKQVRQLSIYRTPKSEFSFTCTKKFDASHLELVSIEPYFEGRRRAFFYPAWQRKEEYLKRYSNFSALMNRNRTAGVLYVGDKNAPCLDAWSATEVGAEELISCVLACLNSSSSLLFSLTNQPEDWIVAFLRANGVDPNEKQLEMSIELS